MGTAAEDTMGERRIDTADIKAIQLEGTGSPNAATMACLRQILCLVQETLKRHGRPAVWPVGKGRGAMDEPDLLQLAFCLDYIAQCKEGIDAVSARSASDRLGEQEAGRMRKALGEAERMTVRLLVSLFQEEILDEQRGK